MCRNHRRDFSEERKGVKAGEERTMREDLEGTQSALRCS